MKTNKIILTVLVALAMAIAAQPAAAASGPNLVQVSYAESDDGSSPPFDLSANGKGIDALRFTTRYGGERASGESKLDNAVDTDLNGEARHPWSLIRKGDGKRVIKLVHKQLFETGVAKVRIRARGDGEHLDQTVEIRLSECSQDPPFYPVSCEVEA
jgi:hypothetical protein